MINLDDVLVVNFAVNERTLSLSELCIKKLGFKNVLTLKSNDGFRQKFIKFSEIAVNSNAECFLRTDADRLLFEGTLEMIKVWFDDRSLLCIEGQCFDFLMSRYRGATPHVFSREAMIKLRNDLSLMPDTQKPESRFTENITKNKTKDWLSIKTLTNLHDYDQYPSKVCNTIVNRLSRGHSHLYDLNYINTLSEDYKKSFVVAAKYFSNHGTKTKMDYVDFSLLDEKMGPIDHSDNESKYEYYKSLYESLR